jgi:hypothetical protein
MQQRINSAVLARVIPAERDGRAIVKRWKHRSGCRPKFNGMVSLGNLPFPAHDDGNQVIAHVSSNRVCIFRKRKALQCMDRVKMAGPAAIGRAALRG